jgi:hypothetical protein
MSSIPPPPPGFILDPAPDASGGAIPPPPPGFVLDAPAEPTTMSGAPIGHQDSDAIRGSRSFAHGMADMATGGLADEAAALIGSLAGNLPGGHGKSYDELLNEVRGQAKVDAEQNPMRAIAGNVVGGLGGGTALVKGGLSFAGRAAESGAGWLTRLVGGAGDGALQAGLYGFGSGEGTKDRFERAAYNMPMGAGLGVAGESLGVVGNAIARPLFRGSDEIADGVNAAANVQAAGEFGIPLSRAQATRSVSQANIEDQLRSQGAMSRFDATQRDAVGTAAGGIQQRMAGEAPVLQSADDAYAGVQIALRGKRDRLKAESQDAYKRSVDDPSVLVPGEAIAELPKFIRGRLAQENIIIDPMYHTGAAKALEFVDNYLGRMPKPGGDVKSVQAQLKWVENMRAGLRKNFPPMGQDAPALRQISRAVDEWNDALFDHGLVSGSDEVLAELKNARAKWTEYKGLTDPRAKNAGQINPTYQAQARVRDIISKEMSPEEIGRYLFGSSVASPKAASWSTALELKKHLGPDSPEWNAVRQSFWLRATRAGDQMLDAGRIAKNIDSFVKDNRSVAATLFSPEELDQMGKFSTTLKILSPAKEGRNGSNTANRMMPALSRYGQNIMGMLGMGTSVAAGAEPLSALGIGAVTSGLAKGASAIRQSSLVDAATNRPIPTLPTGRVTGAIRGVTTPLVEKRNQEVARRKAVMGF